MTPDSKAQMENAGRDWTFEYLPAGLFGSVMGMTGLSGVWASVHSAFGVSIWISHVLAVIAAAGFVALTAAYAVKIAKAPDAVKAEFSHPVAVNMFATFWVSLLLLPIVIAPYILWLGRLLWFAGAGGMMLLAIYIVSRWLRSQHVMAQATPAWILPVVGLLDVPLAIPYLALPELKLFMPVGLAIGLFFAVPLFTMIFSRLVFEPPMPQPMQPTLMILVAPFAVGMSAYVATTDQVDLFAKSLYVLTIFIFVVVAGRLRHLGQCCPFRFAWWAVSFPMAASAIAALRFARAEPTWIALAIAICLAALATCVIMWLFGRTLLGVFRGELRTLSG